MARLVTSNDALIEEAERLMPGGVSSPVRAFKAVGAHPPFIVSGSGAMVRDVEGREYVDLVMSWGALILGHADPEVIAAISAQAARGTTYGMPTPGEVELARRITAAMPSVEMLRFVSSGTEAAMSAVRLARATTGRAAVLKFAGCYHGHSDALLAKAGSGVATFGLPDSAGVTEGATRDTLTVEFNDLASVERVAEEAKLAAIIVEPIVGNMGCVPPEPGFLAGLREVCDWSGALLVFDEVITGFRAGPRGAQGEYGVVPDLTCLGKVIGGGLPLAAYGGRRDLMSRVAPLGPVYQAGTLSGNPLATAAGSATLARLDERSYERLETLGARLEAGLAAAIDQARVPARVQRAGSLLTLFLVEGPVRAWRDADRADRERFARFHRAMLSRGILLPPSQFECWFLSLAHDEATLARVITAAREALAEVRA